MQLMSQPQPTWEIFETFPKLETGKFMIPPLPLSGLYAWTSAIAP